MSEDVQERRELGKTAIVTGGSRGIGSATAEALAEAGYFVLINYNESGEDAQRLEEKLTGSGFEAGKFKADVTDRIQVDAMTEYCLRQTGSIDLLVNNAGVSQQKLFTEISDKDWEYVISVNLKGVFNCTQSVLKHMINMKSGSIINVSSVWGITGASCEVHYSASKAAVIGFTKALAKELGPSGIRVNCVAPGIIDTDMIRQFDIEDRECMKQSTPLMRLGTARDVASCIAFLASDEAGFITGQVISPNGGYVI